MHPESRGMTRIHWTRTAPDGAEVPLDRADRGLFVSRPIPRASWKRLAKLDSGRGRLVEIQRQALALLKAERIRGPRFRKGTPIVEGDRIRVEERAQRVSPKSAYFVSELLDKAGKKKTPAHFAARAYEAALLAEHALGARAAEEAVRHALRACRYLQAANLRRSLERDLLAHRKVRSGASTGGKRPRVRSDVDDQRDAEFQRLRGERHSARGAARLVVLTKLGGSAETIRRRPRQKVGRQPA